LREIRRAVSFEDYQGPARRRLPKVLFDYIDGGAYAEVTIKRNATDFERLCLRQRLMRDMSSINLSSDLLNQRLAHPVILGPMGFADDLLG
jgi:L-lactate dehydrogenase (cytochrome)